MRYDAFISYSHAADDLLAPRLQEVLQHFGKPWYRRRELSVFRDKTGLSANPGLWSSIADALDESEWFLLLASPEAAASPWVNREVDHWIAARGTEKVLVVLTEGTWVWDAGAGRFDVRSTAVPPALATAFVEEPYHLDLTWARAETQVDPRDGRFRDAVATLAAAIRGIPKDELVGVDVREHRRTLRTAWAAAVLLFALTLFSGGAAVAAVRNADQVQDEQAATEDARAEADRQAALARAAADEARANADAARANADRAKANADEAAAQRSDAEASAAEADANASAAEANAAAADANAAEAAANAAAADANAGRARRNQALADASATEAQQAEARALESAAAAEVQRILAVRNAAEAQAAEEEAAANAANAEQQRLLAVAANASLTAANAELAAQQAALEESNGALTSANDALGDANSSLSERNAALEAARLTALATQARDRGNLDLAMLLATEAHRADPTSEVARNELADVTASARHLERYLPGEVEAQGAPLVQGATVVAAYGRNDVETPLLAVWDLDDPEAQPLRIDTRTSGGRDVQLEDSFLMDDGRRLVAWVGQQDFKRTVVVWDLETGAELFRSTPEYRWDAAIRPPTGDVFVVQEGTDVVAVDAVTGARRASWTGVPAARFVATDCLGIQVETTTLAHTGAGECTWSPDGRRLLAWSDADAAWVMWSLDDPSSVVVVGRPPLGTSAPPRFLPGEGTRVAAALEPGAVALVDGNGTRLSTYPVGAVGGVSAIGTATDRVAVADATGGVWSIDTTSGVVSARRDVSSMCSAVTSLRYSEARAFVVVTAAPGCAQGAQFAYVPSAGGLPDIRPDGVAPIAFLDGDSTRAESVNGTLEIRSPLVLSPLSYDVRDCRSRGAETAFVCQDGVVVGAGAAGWTEVQVAEADTLWVTMGSEPDRLVATMPGGRLALFDLSRPPVGVEVPFAALHGSDAVLSPDGTRAVVFDGGTFTIVDRATGASRTVGGLDPDRATPEFSSDSSRLLVRGVAEETPVIDPASGTVLGVLDGRAEVSPDGSVIGALASGAGEVTLVAGADLSPIGAVPIPGLVPRAGAVGPHGEWIALIDVRGDFVVIDTDTGARLVDLPGRFPGLGSQVETLAVSPDGTRLLVTSGSRFDASLWDTSRWVELANEGDAADPLCVGYVDDLRSTWFSPAGDVVAVAGQLLSLDGLTPIGTQAGCGTALLDQYRSVAFPGDGSVVEFLVVDVGGEPPDDLSLVMVSLDPEQLAADACARSGRNLTATVRNRYLGGRGGATCARWPS